jgi:hypothetical protein
MNRQEIIRMAKKAGLDLDGENIFSPKSDPQVDVDIADLEVFAALVASAERERLAKVFDKLDKGIGFYDPHEPAEIIRGQA